MMMLLIILALVVAAALVLALELLRPQATPTDDLTGLSQALAQGRDFEPMLRLFEDRDFETVADLPGGRKKLAKSRGRAARMYLRQLRGDFLQAWAICRLLAPISEDADPVVKLFRQWLSFHGLYALCWVRSLGGPAASPAQARALVAAFSALREGAANLLEQDADLVAAASRA